MNKKQIQRKIGLLKEIKKINTYRTKQDKRIVDMINQNIKLLEEEMKDNENN